MRPVNLLLSLLLCLFLVLTACDGVASLPTSPGAEAGDPGGDSGGGTGEEPVPSSPDAPGEVTDDSPVEPEPKPEPQPGAGQLTAGEWRDLDNWDFWLELMNGEFGKAQTLWGFTVNERVTVQLESKTNDPVIDASVILQDKDGVELWQARTNNRGAATLFPSLFDSANAPYSLRIVAGTEVAEVEDVEVNSEESVKVTLNSAPESDALDLMLVVDTTGSMSDELEYLKAELQNVVGRVKDANPNLDVRLSANYYRDKGDIYVVRSFPFTKDINEVTEQIDAQRSGGGGDYPEAVDQALEDALENHDWRDSARARLLFLVLDAPPHQEQAVLTRMQKLTQLAAEKGIRIIPLGASGIDKETEFLLRFISIATDASYTFLTNDSGIGNEKIEPTIGEYQVDFLNDLMVNIINRYVE